MDEARMSGNIKTLRKKKKITLERLAELTGLTKGYLSKVERARRAPPYSTLNKIALALGVDAAFFLEVPRCYTNRMTIFPKCWPLFMYLYASFA
jgi:transcriptional regulator with XRE-family HTH domain